MNNLVRRLTIAAGGLAFVTLGIGALHMPCARPILMRLGGCPLAGAHMTSKEMDRGRQMALETERGTAAAPARPAVGFALDTTTLADVRAWAERSHVDCEDKHPGLVVCTHVQPAAVHGDPARGAIDELALGFNVKGHLVNETTLRAHLTPEVASDTAKGIVASLAAQLGPAEKSAGDFEAARLAGPTANSISAVSYRYSDYVADVSAMNLPYSGLLIREHYMSATD